MDIFSRYSDFIQDFIYRSGWQDLRAIQVAAGDAIFNTDQNVLLCASTASGKTEAAFFPILTEFAEDPPQSVGCLYIAPLKALINDQFIRLNDLCEEGHIPVWHWHGDVSSSHKKKLLKHPSGILQITPESLEALLMHKHSEVPKLFGDLRYVVIDEIHSLLRGDRGGQCMCLVQRLCRLSGANPRRIGLSATIGDPKEAGRFLAAGSGRSTVIPNIQAKGMRWRLSMEHFYNAAPQASDIIENPEKSAWAGGVPSASMRPAIGTSKQADVAVLAQTREGAKPTDKAPLTADPGMGYIFEHTRSRKCLVFSNSREECEEVTTTLRVLRIQS